MKNEREKQILFWLSCHRLFSQDKLNKRHKFNQNKISFFLCWEYFAEKFIMLLTCFINETILVIAFVVIKIMTVD